MNYAIVVGKRFLIFFIFPFYTDFFNHFEVKKWSKTNTLCRGKHCQSIACKQEDWVIIIVTRGKKKRKRKRKIKHSPFKNKIATFSMFCNNFILKRKGDCSNSSVTSNFKATRDETKSKSIQSLRSFLNKSLLLLSLLLLLLLGLINKSHSLVFSLFFSFY